MRNISFFLTTDQIRDQSKVVTRRLGWIFLKEGDQLMACEKCQGLKPGESLNRLGPIEVVKVTQEPLNAMLAEPYGSEEATREGFPEMDGAAFVAMFTEHMICKPDLTVTRIEFKYIKS